MCVCALQSVSLVVGFFCSNVLFAVAGDRLRLWEVRLSKISLKKKTKKKEKKGSVAVRCSLIASLETSMTSLK